MVVAVTKLKLIMIMIPLLISEVLDEYVEDAVAVELLHMDLIFSLINETDGNEVAEAVLVRVRVLVLTVVMDLLLLPIDMVVEEQHEEVAAVVVVVVVEHVLGVAAEAVALASSTLLLFFIISFMYLCSYDLFVFLSFFISKA